MQSMTQPDGFVRFTSRRGKDHCWPADHYEAVRDHMQAMSILAARKRSAAAVVKRVIDAPPLTSDEVVEVLIAIACNVEASVKASNAAQNGHANLHPVHSYSAVSALTSTNGHRHDVPAFT